METERKNGWGGRRANQTGRPKKAEKSECHTITFAPGEWERVKELAEKAGKSVSRYLVESALNAEEGRALP